MMRAFNGQHWYVIVHLQLIQTSIMGQTLPKDQPITELTPQVIDQHIELLFNKHTACEKMQPINQSIVIITRDLALNGSFSKGPEGTKVNHTLLKCLYHPNFEATIKNLVFLLSKQLKSILEAKVIAMISREKFRKCLNSANFCIFFTDQSLIQSVNLLSIRSDLDPQSKKQVLEYTKDFAEINQSLIDTLGQQKLLQLCRIFRLSINLMIDLHLKLLTRSDFTLKIIDRLIQSLFILYAKVLLQNQEKDISRREFTENAKSILRLGAYFIGLGLQSKSASVYELGVIVLQRLLALKGQELKGQKALPSHLFKSLPVINNNQMMNWLSNNLLFALKYIKNETNYFSRMNFNRIPSFKLVTRIFEKFHPSSNQISYLLEQICLQTKTFQIERVYVSKLAEVYSKLDKATDIIKKYAEVGQVNFNLKANAKQIKIKPEDVRTQLESDQESTRKEVVALCGKYTIQVIFQKTEVLYEYSDKSLWNMILCQLEEEGAIGKEQPVQLNKEGEEEEKV